MRPPPSTNQLVPAYTTIRHTAHTHKPSSTKSFGHHRTKSFGHHRTKSFGHPKAQAFGRHHTKSLGHKVPRAPPNKVLRGSSLAPHSPSPASVSPSPSSWRHPASDPGLPKLSQVLQVSPVSLAKLSHVKPSSKKSHFSQVDLSHRIYQHACSEGRILPH